MSNKENKINDYLRNKISGFFDRYGFTIDPTEPSRYEIIYSEYEHLLSHLFASLHYHINNSFQTFNIDISNASLSTYCSDRFKKIIDDLEELQTVLKGTKYNFDIIPSYKKPLNDIKEYLFQISNSQDYPPFNFKKIELEKYNPIFHLKSTISTDKSGVSIPYDLEFIGEGSYAIVHKYKDKFYNRFFALKTARKNLNSLELERFRTEFFEMKKLKSPYVLDVFYFDEENHRYIMEHAESSLSDYIKNHNNSIDVSKRIEFVQQIFKAFTYIHSKNILHRDISPSNILLKMYDGTELIKVSDFGLVKLPDSQFTNQLTEIKGSFNDPILTEVGFANYKLHHEIYSLSRVIYFIFTGRTTKGSFMNTEFQTFIEKGTNTNVQKRYKNVEEMRIDFEKIIPSLQQVGV
ncbi:protein kinase [Bacillus cereus]|uniref:protein kinase domain-containing protein n=1 Tax=Bacillus cereus TaxID=1396 RepID=UPI00156ACBB6|nr:protein kinase [Bacillus cereus]NRQ69712.1 protein kinase [Bacillus cereus]